MKFFTFVCIALFTSLLLTVKADSEESDDGELSNDDEIEDDDERIVNKYSGNAKIGISLAPHTECGGVIPIIPNTVATISYKEGQYYRNNEFCVWTIVWNENVHSILLDIDQSWMEPYWDGLVAYTYGHRGLVSHKIDSLNYTTIRLTTAPVFLAFSTDSSVTRHGFRVAISALNDGRWVGSANIKAFHFNDDQGVFSFPARDNLQDTFDSNEIISVVVQGQTGGSTSVREIELRDTGADTTAHVYSLLPYRFAPNFGEIGKFKGEKVGRVSGATTRDVYPNLYVFTSEVNNTARPFSISWKNQPYSHNSSGFNTDDNDDKN